MILLSISLIFISGCTSTPQQPPYVISGLVNITVQQNGDDVYIIEEGGPEFLNVSSFEMQLSSGNIYGESVTDNSPAIGKEVFVGKRSQSPDNLIVTAVFKNGTREIVIDTLLRP